MRLLVVLALALLGLSSIHACALMPGWVKPGVWIKLGTDSYPGHFVVTVLNATDEFVWVKFSFVQIGGKVFSSTYVLDVDGYIIEGNHTGAAFPFLFFPTPKGIAVNVTPGVNYRLEYTSLFGRDVYILSSGKYRFMYDARSRVFVMSSTPNNTDRIYIVDTNAEGLRDVVSWGNLVAPRLPNLLAYFAYGAITFMVLTLAFMFIFSLLRRRLRRAEGK